MKSAQIKNIIPWPEDSKERKQEEPLAPPRIEAMEAVDPEKAGRCMNLPPLSLLLMHSMDREKIEEIKKEESVPVLVVFPARGDEELLTLEREIQILQPLLGRIIDEVWIAFGGNEHDDIPLMAKKYGARVFYAHRNGMNDARRDESGKGLSMRGLLYHLVADRGLNHPRAIIQFVDADIKEGYFNPRWVIDPVGAVLWFKRIEVAKIVYHRPWGEDSMRSSLPLSRFSTTRRSTL